MKTIKDVIEKYPKGVDCNYDSFGYNSKSGTLFTCPSIYEYSNPYEYKICTREEYEQELAKTNTVQWYDYDKQQSISLPPVGVECECSLDFDGSKKAPNWNRIEVLYVDESTVVGKILEGSHLNSFSNGFESDIYKFRPLDWDKNKERDEFIGKCYNKIIPSNPVDRVVFERLYNAGARFND